MKERNVSGTICSRCKKYVAPRSGWLIKDGIGTRFVYHSNCYEQKVAEDKQKLKDALDIIGKHASFKKKE